MLNTVKRETKRAWLCEIFVRFVKKDQWRLIITRRAKPSIELNATIVQRTDKTEDRYGKSLVTKRKPHVINAALQVNIWNNLMCSISTAILVIVGIQI